MSWSPCSPCLNEVSRVLYPQNYQERIRRTTHSFFVEPSIHSARPLGHTLAVREIPKLALNMKILIVEDSPQMRQMIRDVVADLAEDVTECADGAEAAASYAAQQFSGDDRVLMDLEMPGIGGLEATRRIRAAFPDAQIIVVTQYDDQHWRTAATEAGACGYLLKENLLELRRMLKKPPPVTS
jgi:CheY-like chemotaxis protein